MEIIKEIHPNQDGLFAGEADYRALEDKLLDGADQSRKTFSVTAANTFWLLPIEVLLGIHAGGWALFRDRARVTYANQQLRDEDFERMWRIINMIRIERRAKRAPRVIE